MVQNIGKFEKVSGHNVLNSMCLIISLKGRSLLGTIKETAGWISVNLGYMFSTDEGTNTSVTGGLG